MPTLTQWPTTEDDVLLRHGAIASVRLVRETDRDALIELHRSLSDQSRYLRFFSLGEHSAVDFVDRLIAGTARQQAVAFVVSLHDRVVGLGNCTSIDDKTAEVAFAVADDMHGQGIGTLLLERLAECAERSGVTELVANVLADNRAMIDVIKASGFSTTTVRDYDTVELRFPVYLTEQLLDAIATREGETDAASIRALLAPASVAVIGASRKPGAPGHVVMQNLLDSGFPGPVHPVNPAAGEILGRPAYASILDVPETVDLAVVAVPAPAVPGVVQECATKRVKGIVILSSGFAETDPAGRALQDDVLRAARRGDMRVIGPNCLGIANTDPEVRMDATFATTSVLPGCVGMMTQSGAVGIAALRRATELGIGLSSFVSAGNKADISGNDMLMYYGSDERTQVIALYLESFGNPRKFSRLARMVSVRKPIVALVGGASKAGRRAASGHTAAAVTSSFAVDALFGQCGVVRAHSLEQFLHITGVLSHQPLPQGRRVAIVGNGGGPGVLAADACAEAGIDLAELDEGVTSAIRTAVPGVASASNPVDLGAGVTTEQFAEALDAVAHDRGVHVVVAVHTPVAGFGDDDFAAVVRASTALAGKTTLAVMLGERTGREPIACGDSMVPVFSFPEDVAQALQPILAYVDWRAAARGDVPQLEHVRTQDARDLVAAQLEAHPGGRRLDSDTTSELLGHYGISVVPATSAAGAEAAVEAASLAGFPVVLKLADPDLVHKSDVGGVRLDLDTTDEVRSAYEDMAAADTQRDAPLVLVQRQVKGGTELIIGVSQDPIFGPLLMFGLGGTATELLADRVFRLTPLTDAGAAETVRSLRGSPLLFGYRGAAPADVPALEDLLLRLSRLADELPQIAEIDLNPVIAYEHGVAVVDAKIRIHPAPYLPSPVLRRLSPTMAAH
ncbi:MAG: GNAT family N-acetyltransferase [Streptosporangiales bacterium]|nr:GNAT family N-acetyltransferase [Streptosporangiales bacterium]